MCLGQHVELFMRGYIAEQLHLDQKLKWDLTYGLMLGRIHDLGDLHQLIQWVQQKLKDITGLVHSAEQLMNKAIQEALKEPGVSGDPEMIVYVARTIAQVRRELLIWTIDFNCTEVKPECKRIMSLISAFSQNVLDQLESIPKRLEEEVAKAESAYSRGEKYVGHLQLTFSIPENAELSAEFAKLTQMLSEFL
jgi:hypothetical protein